MDNDYMKPQEALGLLCSAIRCGEEFGPVHEKARLSILSALAQAADAGRYREGLDIIKDAVTQHEDGEFYPGEPASVLAFISGTAIGHLEALQGEA